jgi:hypothetical protein
MGVPDSVSGGGWTGLPLLPREMRGFGVVSVDFGERAIGCNMARAAGLLKPHHRLPGGLCMPCHNILALYANVEI